MKSGLQAAALGCLLGAAASASAVADAQPAQTSTTSAAVEAREAALFGEAEDDREAALFGAPATSSAAEDREAALFERPDPSEPADRPGVADRLFDEMAEKDDFLDIGGVLWLWLQAAGAQGQPFEETGLSSPSFLDVYLDARPSSRVRAYARARTNYDPTVDESATNLFGASQQKTRVRLDQLWLKLDIYRKVFLTIGKQRIRWGTGRIWNPTDFLNPNRLDALNFLDVRLGVALMKVHVPIEALGWNFYAIMDVDDASRFDQIGGALRAEALIGTAEVSLSAALRKDRPIRLGADLSVPIWELDLRVEGALLHDVRRPFFDERVDIRPVESFGTIDTIEEIAYLRTLFFEPPSIDRRDDWIPQIVVGLDYALRYNDEDVLGLGIEYFFNDAGTDVPGTYFVAGLNGAFEPLYAGRHYVALTALLAAPGDWNDSTILAFALANLSDRTGLVRINYTVNVLTYLRVNAFGSVAMGRRGGEFRFGFDVPPVDPALLVDGEGNPTAIAEQIPPELTGGFELRAPLWQAGLTLVVDL